jgi:hypothetical protein
MELAKKWLIALKALILISIQRNVKNALNIVKSAGAKICVLNVTIFIPQMKKVNAKINVSLIQPILHWPNSITKVLKHVRIALYKIALNALKIHHVFNAQ